MKAYLIRLLTWMRELFLAELAKSDDLEIYTSRLQSHSPFYAVEITASEQRRQGDLIHSPVLTILWVSLVFHWVTKRRGWIQEKGSISFRKFHPPQLPQPRKERLSYRIWLETLKRPFQFCVTKRQMLIEISLNTTQTKQQGNQVWRQNHHVI